MTTTVKHPDRLAEQINNILANPDSWRQAAYHADCGTKHCIAGHGQIASGKSMNVNTCRADAREWYGLTGNDSDWLFHCDRTMPELHGFAVAALAGEPHFGADGYDRYGYNRDGFARDGYDCEDYDFDGYHRNGYDCDGYARDGYDRHGYNRKGFNRDGGRLPLLTITGDK